jgi:hypothetical protein
VLVQDTEHFLLQENFNLFRLAIARDKSVPWCILVIKDGIISRRDNERAHNFSAKPSVESRIAGSGL